MGIGPGWPPHEMTAEEVAATVNLTPQFQDLLRLRKVNYATWGVLAASGILEISDFAALFASDADCTERCAAVLEFVQTDAAGNWPQRKHILNKVKVLLVIV